MARSVPLSPRFTGFFRNTVNGRLAVYYNGTLAGYFNASGFTGTIVANTSISATTTITAGTGGTVTAGNEVVTAGDLRVTAGNERLGAVEAFGTTEPTSALVMKTGTAPVGAIATSGGIFSSTTVVRKIIAAGTVSNVET